MDRYHAACLGCRTVFTFRVTEWQYEQLESGVDPHDVIHESMREYATLIATSMCPTCWLEMEIELADHGMVE